MTTPSVASVAHWSDRETRAWQTLLTLAVAEDFGAGDLTSESLVPAEIGASGKVTCRQTGVVAGLPAINQTLAMYDTALFARILVPDGAKVSPGSVVAEIQGPARSLLAAERVVLNLLTHLSGIATLTARYVESVAGTRATIYDTRKTLAGWRTLEKYAVRCGGGWNHRTGLNDAILIKDNHLWVGSAARRFTPAEAVRQAQRLAPEGVLVEIEVDTLNQLEEVLPAGPDVVLLDNLGLGALREAVLIRDRVAPNVLLEASGGVNLNTVAGLAETGVERISVGALTHSAPALDLGLDFAS